MIIEVLTQKYRIGCNRGIAKIEKTNLLVYLNMIIDWDKSEFPKIKEEEYDDGGEKKKRVVEDRDFLGNPPELKPGDCFLFNGQVIAVDSTEKLVLIVSETGPLSLERIWEEEIEPEIDLIYGKCDVEVLGWEKVTPAEASGEIITIPHSQYRKWRDEFIKKNQLGTENFYVKIEVESPELLFPVTMYFGWWNVLYNPEDFYDENHAKDIVKQTISWFHGRE